MSREFDEWESFQRNPMANVDEVKPAPVRDGLDEFVEEVELEQAGGLTLPPRQPRLRSSVERDEPLEKSASARKKIELAKFLKRKLALGERLEDVISFAEQHSREIGDLLREIVSSGLLEEVEA